MFGNRGGQDPGGFFNNFFGGGGGGMGGAGGAVARRFDQQYQCWPVSFIGRDELEKGNKIILPPSALDTLARLNISYPMLFEVSNGQNRSHCGVLEFVADEGTCYLPFWLLQNLCLSEGQIVRIMNTSLPKGSFVKLRPVTSDFLSIHNPRAVLENTLRNFATLTEGDQIAISYNSKNYDIEVLECRPASAISIIETDVNVDFAPPKDYVEPVAQPKAAPQPDFLKAKQNDELNDAASSVAQSVASSSRFGGEGKRLDGKAAKLSAPITPRQSESDDEDELPDGTKNYPWLNTNKKKIYPRGIRQQPPYGFNTGHLSGKQGYKLPTAKANIKKEMKLFGGSGNVVGEL